MRLLREFSEWLWDKMHPEEEPHTTRTGNGYTYYYRVNTGKGTVSRSTNKGNR